MRIPFFILLANERAESFRRYVALCSSYYPDQLPNDDWDDFWSFWQEISLFRPYRGGPMYPEFPLVVDRALLWANHLPPPPADALMEARAILEAAIATWFDTCEKGAALLAKIRDKHRFVYPRLDESLQLAANTYLRLKRALAESWPVTFKEDEEQALAEMKSGNALDLDDAFAGIAGCTKKQWLKRVEEHKRKYPAGGPLG